MSDFTYPTTNDLNIVSIMVGGGGLFANAKCLLSTTGPAADVKNVDLSAFTAPSSTITPPSALVWSTPYIDTDGRPVAASSDQVYIATVVPGPETVTHVYLTDNAGINLLGYGVLDTPWNLHVAGQGMTVVVKVRRDVGTLDQV